jgi:hypothetical protein
MTVDINREEVSSSAIKEFLKLKPQELKTFSFSFKFRDEIGIDAGKFLIFKNDFLHII